MNAKTKRRKFYKKLSHKLARKNWSISGKDYHKIFPYIWYIR